jgi:methyl-accepting chemotaxis protein
MSEAASTRPSVERRLLLFLAIIAAVAVAGVLAILPYRLYERDVRLAEVNAHRIGSLLHVALGHALQQGTDVRDVADLANRFQGIAGLELRLRQLEPGEMHPAATSGRASSERRDTDLTYTAAPILDRDGHTWLATMHFDLSPMKRESMRLIFDLVLAVVLASLAFSAAIFWLIRNTLLQPLHEVTERVEEFAAGHDPGPTPAFGSRELATLMDALDRARRMKAG